MNFVTSAADQIKTLQALLLSDPLRRKALEAVASLKLPDCWIGAGFVRDAVWDSIHGFGTCAPRADVDVVWFEGELADERLDRRLEDKLLGRLPELKWSVKNQARMHLRNRDVPYTSVADAMRHWPETATAVAARLRDDGSIEINAPFGTGDLFALRLRPTPAFAVSKLPIFNHRIEYKRWIERYPRLELFAEVAAVNDGQ